MNWLPVFRRGEASRMGQDGRQQRPTHFEALPVRDLDIICLSPRLCGAPPRRGGVPKPHHAHQAKPTQEAPMAL